MLPEWLRLKLVESLELTLVEPLKLALTDSLMVSEPLPVAEADVLTVSELLKLREAVRLVVRARLALQLRLTELLELKLVLALSLSDKLNVSDPLAVPEADVLAVVDLLKLGKPVRLTVRARLELWLALPELLELTEALGLVLALADVLGLDLALTDTLELKLWLELLEPLELKLITRLELAERLRLSDGLDLRLWLIERLRLEPTDPLAVVVVVFEWLTTVADLVRLAVCRCVTEALVEALTVAEPRVRLSEMLADGCDLLTELLSVPVFERLIAVADLVRLAVSGCVTEALAEMEPVIEPRVRLPDPLPDSCDLLDLLLVAVPEGLTAVADLLRLTVGRCVPEPLAEMEPVTEPNVRLSETVVDLDVVGDMLPVNVRDWLSPVVDAVRLSVFGRLTDCVLVRVPVPDSLLVLSETVLDLDLVSDLLAVIEMLIVNDVVSVLVRVSNAGSSGIWFGASHGSCFGEISGT